MGARDLGELDTAALRDLHRDLLRLEARVNTVIEEFGQQVIELGHQLRQLENRTQRALVVAQVLDYGPHLSALHTMLTGNTSSSYMYQAYMAHMAPTSHHTSGRAEAFAQEQSKATPIYQSSQYMAPSHHTLGTAEAAAQEQPKVTPLYQAQYMAPSHHTSGTGEAAAQEQLKATQRHGEEGEDRKSTKY